MLQKWSKTAPKQSSSKVIQKKLHKLYHQKIELHPTAVLEWRSFVRVSAKVITKNAMSIQLGFIIERIKIFLNMSDLLSMLLSVQQFFILFLSTHMQMNDIKNVFRNLKWWKSIMIKELFYKSNIALVWR